VLFARLLLLLAKQEKAVEDLARKHRSSSHMQSEAPQSAEAAAEAAASRESARHRKQAVDRATSRSTTDAPYTHFLSLPLPSFHSSVDTLRSSILASHPTAPGLEPSIFVCPTSLHFTVCMLALPTSEHVQRAAEALTSVAVPMSDGLDVRLCGLAVMNDRPEAAHVMYMQPDEPSQQRLSELAARLINAMRRAGVLSDGEMRKQRMLSRDRTSGEERVNVKWHATVINTKHRRRSGGDRHGGFRRQPVDVSSVLAQYGSTDWGEGAIATCELSRLSWDETTLFYPCDGRLLL